MIAPGALAPEEFAPEELALRVLPLRPAPRNGHARICGHDDLERGMPFGIPKWLIGPDGFGAIASTGRGAAAAAHESTIDWNRLQ